MFDQITIITYGFTGKLKDAPTLRKWFWPFLIAIFVSMAVLGYNSFMSLNYYRGLLEKFTFIRSDSIPIIVTVLIAVFLYFQMSSITGTILDYWKKRKYKTDGHEPMFAAAIIVMAVMLGLDIYANLQGVEHVSHNTTEVVMDNPLDNIEADAEVRRTNVINRFDPDIQKHEKVIERIRDLPKAKETGHNRICKNVCPYKLGTGAVHWNGVITPFGFRLIDAYQAKIDELESQKRAELATILEAETTKRETAKDDYSRDKNRYDTTVKEKQSGHTKLVYFAYAIAFLLSMIVNHYCDTALAKINPDREAELIAAHSTREDRQKAATAAMSAKYQVAGSETALLMKELIALMKDKEEPIGTGKKRKIGFKDDEEEEPTKGPSAKHSSAELVRIKRELEALRKVVGEGKNLPPKKVNESPGNFTPNQGENLTIEKKEIHLNNTHPKFTKRVQPDEYRGINEQKYSKFLKVANQVLAEKGRYVKAEIVKKSGLTKPTVTRYMKLAIEIRNDLSP